MKISQKKRKRNLSMRPILLKGHERPITQVKYNPDGDLLFTASSDAQICLWYSESGERIGNYQSQGAVSSFDVSQDSDLLLMGSKDETVRLWRVATGEELFTWKIPGRAVSVEMNYGNTQFLVSFNSNTTQSSRIQIYSLNTAQAGAQSSRPVKDISLRQEKEKIKQTSWGYMNENLVTVTDQGSVYVHDPETGKEVREPLKDNTEAINAISFSKDRLFFVTCSDDHTAKLYDSKSFQLLKTYETNYPVNAASISPALDQIVIGGGQHAKGAAMSSTDTSQFSSRFYHLIDEEELATVRGHFGPVNSLAFSPDGKSFTSGAEEGTVRIHHLPADYFNGALEEAAESEMNAELSKLL